jgi:hypothetical protein
MSVAPEPLDPHEPEGPRLSEFADPDAEVDHEVRRHPSTIGGAVYLVVLGATLTGVVITTLGRWQLGLTWMGLALLGGAFARLVLPADQMGMLHTRRRLVDVVLYAALGAGILSMLLTLIPPRQG